MATQKKYHDLVILDQESTGANQVNTKKLVSGILFFIIGVFIGALLISALNNKEVGLIQNTPATVESSPSNDSSNIVPIITELQSITSITSSSEESGCGIESLEKNSLEGCSADSFTESPLEATETNSTEITDLNFLNTPEDTSNNDNVTPAPESGMTNILDLQ